MSVLAYSHVRIYGESIGIGLAARTSIRFGGVFSDGDELVCAADAEGVEVVLVDMASPGSEEAVKLLGTLAESPAIIALSSHANEEELLACLRMNISGYLSREASLDDLCDAVHASLRGEFACSGRAVRVLVDELRKVMATAREPEPVLEELTPREREVLTLIEKGYSNQAISTSLFIEVSTVKNHVHNILEKLGAKTRGQAAALFRQLLPPAPAYS